MQTQSVSNSGWAAVLGLVLVGGLFAGCTPGEAFEVDRADSSIDVNPDAGPEGGLDGSQEASSLEGSVIEAAIEASLDAFADAPIDAPNAPLETLADRQNNPWGIAVDNGFVFWTNGGTQNKADGTVQSMHISGGTLTALAAGQTSPNRIVVHGDYVYWTNTVQSGAVMRTARGGGTYPEIIASAQVFPLGIAVGETAQGETAVYWASADGAIYLALIRGPQIGQATSIASHSLNQAMLQLFGNELFWTESANPGAVVRLTVGTNMPRQLATDEAFPNGFSLHENLLVYACMGGGMIKSVDIDSSAPNTAVQVLASEQNGAADVITDEHYLFWTNYDGGQVMRLAWGETVPEVFAEGQTSPSSLAQDDSYLYWTNCYTNGQVMRRLKSAQAVQAGPDASP